MHFHCSKLIQHFSNWINLNPCNPINGRKALIRTKRWTMIGTNSFSIISKVNLKISNKAIQIPFRKNSILF